MTDPNVIEVTKPAMGQILADLPLTHDVHRVGKDCEIIKPDGEVLTYRIIAAEAA